MLCIFEYIMPYQLCCVDGASNQTLIIKEKRESNKDTEGICKLRQGVGDESTKKVFPVDTNVGLLGCGPVARYQLFRRTYCLHLQS
jgi:hypothetical protein